LTIFFPDLSEYNNVTVAAGTPAVVARATIGNETDGKYQSYKQQAAAAGAFFVAYHFLNTTSVGTGSPEQQAEVAHSVVGNVPLMLDAEPNRGGNATVDEMCRFIDHYRAVGGTINVAYIPRWSWERLGSPNLQALADRHISLVSSNYTSYSDNGPGWAPYGGLTPAVWQYTDAQGYGGGSSDFNAFRGTIDQLRTLFGDDVALTDEDKVFIRTQAIAVIQWISQGHDSLNPGGGAIGDDNAAVTLPAVKHKIEAIQASTGGLSDADRAAVKALTDAVNALNSRLSTP
jgi:GH25 family lysozyme M1 (1,4-beta-N-acetylmuramidase)